MRKTYGAEYPDTLPALLTWSERNASAPAVTDATATLTRHALQDRVLRVAGGLRKAGIGAGARVALWLPNSADCLAAIFACARLGALAVHINTRFRPAEVGSLLRRTRAGALVTQWGFAPAASHRACRKPSCGLISTWVWIGLLGYGLIKLF
jgi:fatty-acyl-CoA synthase